MRQCTICKLYIALFLICTNSLLLVSSETPIESPRRHKENTTLVFDRNVYKDSNKTTLYHALCNQTVLSTSVECAIYSTVYRNSISTTENLFNLTLAGRYNSSLKLVSLTRFSFDKIILKWHEVRYNTRKNQVQVARAIYSVIDINTHAKSELSFYIGMAESDPNLLNEVIVRNATDFDVVISSVSACEGFDKCWIGYYRSTKLPATVPYPLLFNFSYPVIEAAEGDAYFVHGYNPPTHRYKLSHVTVDNIQTDLIVLHQDVKIVSHRGVKDFIACYVEFPETYTTGVMCTRFWLDGRHKQEYAFKFYGSPVQLKQVVDLDGEGLLVLAERNSCSESDCWRLMVAKISDDGEEEIHRIDLSCVGDTSKLVLSANARGNDFLYACERSDEYEVEKSYFGVERASFT